MVVVPFEETAFVSSEAGVALLSASGRVLVSFLDSQVEEAVRLGVYDPERPHRSLYAAYCARQEMELLPFPRYSEVSVVVGEGYVRLLDYDGGVLVEFEGELLTEAIWLGWYDPSHPRRSLYAHYREAVGTGELEGYDPTPGGFDDRFLRQINIRWE